MTRYFEDIKQKGSLCVTYRKFSCIGNKCIFYRIFKIFLKKKFFLVICFLYVELCKNKTNSVV